MKNKYEWSEDFAEVHSPQRLKLLRLLWDLKWHHHVELRIAGVRYSARLLELKRLGYLIESKSESGAGIIGVGHGKYYRLVSHETTTPKRRDIKVFLDPDDVAFMLRAGLHIPAPAKKELNDALERYHANLNKL